MLLFRDEEHINRWTRVRGMNPGATLTPDQAWQLALAWYKDKLKPDWKRHTLEKAEALLASIGLTGSFWNLRG